MSYNNESPQYKLFPATQKFWPVQNGPFCIMTFKGFLYCFSCFLGKVSIKNMEGDFTFCQTPSPVHNWELTLLSLGNKNKNDKNNQNNPHIISFRRGCPRVVKICMQTILSLIRWKTPSFFSPKWKTTSIFCNGRRPQFFEHGRRP